MPYKRSNVKSYRRKYRKGSYRRAATSYGRRGMRALGPNPLVGGSARMVADKAQERGRLIQLRGLFGIYVNIASPSYECIVARTANNYQQGMVACGAGAIGEMGTEWWIGIPHLAANCSTFIGLSKQFNAVRFNSIKLSYIPQRIHNFSSDDDSFPATIAYNATVNESAPNEATDQTMLQQLASASTQFVDLARAFTLMIPLKSTPALRSFSNSGLSSQTQGAGGWYDTDLLLSQTGSLPGLLNITCDRLLSSNPTSGKLPVGAFAYSIDCTWRGQGDARDQVLATNAEIPGLLLEAEV